MKCSHISVVGILFTVVIIIGTMGCSAEYHAKETQKGLDGDRITVGTAQRKTDSGADLTRGHLLSQVRERQLQLIGGLRSPVRVSTDCVRPCQETLRLL